MRRAATAASPAFGLRSLLVYLCWRAGGAVKSFTVWSEPIFLHRGEVHNAWVRPKALPAEVIQEFAGRDMHLSSMQLDIVRVDNRTGVETTLPLYQVYNHHHALLMGPTKDLERVYNYSRHSDPLNPHPHRGARGGRHQHGGCGMMRGAALRSLLAEVAHHASAPGRPRPRISAFGGASGAEFRGTSTAIPTPYAYRVQGPVQSFMVLMHFINTRGSPQEAKLWECPCTSARDINVTNGTIDGQRPVPFQCSGELLREWNTACALGTYRGGYRCCEDGVYLTEEGRPAAPEAPDQIQAKFTFRYLEDGDVAPEALRPVTAPGCCDASAGEGARHFGNLEYDVPQCAPGTPPELCVHEVSSIQPFDEPWQNQSEPVDPDEELELIHAWGHQHVGGLSLELFREATGELICRTVPVYGNGSVPGDEAGYLVGIPPCVWGPPPLAAPPRIRRRDLLRTVARYNSTEPHHGVMSLWLLTAAPLRPPAPAGAPDFLV